MVQVLHSSCFLFVSVNNYESKVSFTHAWLVTISVLFLNVVSTSTVRD